MDRHGQPDNRTTGPRLRILRQCAMGCRGRHGRSILGRPVCRPEAASIESQGPTASDARSADPTPGSPSMRIALDAMGGDHAPGPIVAGAVEAVRQIEGLTVVLVGDQARVEYGTVRRRRRAPRTGCRSSMPPRSSGMHEKPVEALRRKRDNSISVCWGLMAAGEVKAVVSAGNTGAMVAAGLFNAKMFLPGVRRPGIAAIFPSQGAGGDRRRRRQHASEARGPVPVRGSWAPSTPSTFWASSGRRSAC